MRGFHIYHEELLTNSQQEVILTVNTETLRIWYLGGYLGFFRYKT